MVTTTMVIFHRIIEKFMIQGGDPTEQAEEVSLYGAKTSKIECARDLEFDKAGILAMANAGPGTNGSQFFITTAATPWLHMNHTIFGEVIEGMDVVEKLEGVKKGAGDRPVDEQKIIAATICE
jgi:peptidylprolyl isomerase